jgi:hypothetical protein
VYVCVFLLKCIVHAIAPAARHMAERGSWVTLSESSIDSLDCSTKTLIFSHPALAGQASTVLR